MGQGSAETKASESPALAASLGGGFEVALLRIDLAEGSMGLGLTGGAVYGLMDIARGTDGDEIGPGIDERMVVNARRFRLGLEASAGFPAGGSGELQPSLKVEGRYDLDGSFPGFGVDGAAGLLYRQRDLGLTVSANGYYQLWSETHSGGGGLDVGVSVEL